jgi:hypothetical protein
MGRDALEDSQNDETQLNDLHRRVKRAEGEIQRLDGAQREDHDLLTKHDVTLSDLKAVRDRGGERSWSLVLIGVGVLIQVAGFIIGLVMRAK